MQVFPPSFMIHVSLFQRVRYIAKQGVSILLKKGADRILPYDFCTCMKKYIKYAILFVAGIIIFLGYKYELHAYLTEENITAWIESFGHWGPLVYMVLYYVAILFFLPATVFTILAGLLFGKFWGSVYVVIAATLSAQTAFYITRYLGSDAAQKFSKDKRGMSALIEKIRNQCEKKCKLYGFRTFFIMRCLFLPYIPLSYAAGLIKTAKASDFFFATLVTNMIFSPAFVYFGDQLSEGPKALILPVILIGLVLSMPRIVKKLRKE